MLVIANKADLSAPPALNSLQSLAKSLLGCEVIAVSAQEAKNLEQLSLALHLLTENKAPHDPC